MTNPSELAVRPEATVVPGAYAEKAMATFMQLHGELMEEKERRVDMYRRLMEKEQALAELKMYVKLLEEKVASKKVVRRVPAPPPKPVVRKVRPRALRPIATVTPIQSARGTEARRAADARESARAGEAQASAVRKAVDGWKAW